MTRKLVVIILITTIPLNLFYKITLKESFVNNILVDYLLVKIHLSDLIILITTISNLRYLKKRITNFLVKIVKQKILVIVLILTLVNQLINPQPLLALVSLVKIIETIIFYFLVQKYAQRNGLKKIINTLFIITNGLFLLSLYQLLNQRPLLPYYFLGETKIDQSLLTAKGRWWNGIYQLPYATTPHPNILAGFFILVLIIIIQTRNTLIIKTKNLQIYDSPKYQEIIFYTVINMSLLIAIITQSWTAMFSWIIILIFVIFFQHQHSLLKTKILTNYLYFLLVIITSIIISTLVTEYMSKRTNHPSWTRRSQLNEISYQAMQKNFILGLGLNRFIHFKETEAQQKVELMSFIQPVHNVFLLIFSELGIIGGIILLSYFVKELTLANKLNILLLLPIANLDHYLITSQTGILLFTLMLALCQNCHYQTSRIKRN